MKDSNTKFRIEIFDVTCIMKIILNIISKMILNPCTLSHETSDSQGLQKQLLILEFLNLILWSLAWNPFRFFHPGKSWNDGLGTIKFYMPTSTRVSVSQKLVVAKLVTCRNL